MNGPSPGYLSTVGGALAEPASTYNPAPQGEADAAAFMGSSSAPQTGADAARFMATPPTLPTAQATPYGTGAAPPGAFGPPAPAPAAPGRYGGAAPSSYFDNSPIPGAPPPAAAPPPGAGGPGASPFLQQVHGAMTGNVAAKETELRGPQLLAAQNQRNEAFAGAISAVDERAQHTQAADMALALDQERKAGIREDAANYSAAERANELADRQSDFDQSVKALSKQSIDPNRYWSNANVGVKLATLIGVALGGFVQGKRGGENAGMNTVKMMIDDDVKAQEAAYGAARDTVNAKQTAFSMAMQKYNNVDAARAAARASALDAAQAQVAQQSAMWKGADAQGHAQMAMASLASDRANQIAQGVAFVPAHQVAIGAKYIDPRTGLSYSEGEAKGLVKTMDEEEFKRGEQNTGIAGQLLVKREEEQGKQLKDARALTVRLPNGDTVMGRDAGHAKELADAAASIHDTDRLVREAEEIRNHVSFRVPGSGSRARLNQIQSELITGYGVQNRLGALSNSDMVLAKNGTAQLTDFGPGPEAALDRLKETAQSKLQSQTRTLTDAPATAKGEMPASFTPHGKK